MNGPGVAAVTLARRSSSLTPVIYLAHKHPHTHTHTHVHVHVGECRREKSYRGQGRDTTTPGSSRLSINRKLDRRPGRLNFASAPVYLAVLRSLMPAENGRSFQPERPRRTADLSTTRGYTTRGYTTRGLSRNGDREARLVSLDFSLFFQFFTFFFFLYLALSFFFNFCACLPRSVVPESAARPRLSPPHAKAIRPPRRCIFAQPDAERRERPDKVKMRATFSVSPTDPGTRLSSLQIYCFLNYILLSADQRFSGRVVCLKKNLTFFSASSSMHIRRNRCSILYACTDRITRYHFHFFNSMDQPFLRSDSFRKKIYGIMLKM